jgi:hypothetical protein
MEYKIKYDELKEFLLTLDYDKIKSGELVKAHTMNDIEYFYKTDEEKRKITYDQVIDYGKPFLVDAIGNDLSVCILTRRKHKLPTGRVTPMKFDRTIIDDCRKVFGSPVNDYFVIPNRFITYA